MLITTEDEARVAQIAESTKPSEKDALWLCGMVHQLAKIKPTEYDFPVYAALIQFKEACAFALGFVGTVLTERQTRIDGPLHDGTSVILQVDTSCPITDAMLCVRPYIRVEAGTDRKSWSPKTNSILQRMAQKATIRVDIDNIRIISDAPAEEYLIGLDGYGLRRRPSNFLPSWGSLQEGKFFGVGDLDWQGLTTPAKYGVFLPHSTTIVISITHLQLHARETVTLSTGLVMGHYSTKTRPPGVNNPSVMTLREFSPSREGAQS